MHTTSAGAIRKTGSRFTRRRAETAAGTPVTVSLRRALSAKTLPSIRRLRYSEIPLLGRYRYSEIPLLGRYRYLEMPLFGDAATWRCRYLEMPRCDMSLPISDASLSRPAFVVVFPA